MATPSARTLPQSVCLRCVPTSCRSSSTSWGRRCNCGLVDLTLVVVVVVEVIGTLVAVVVEEVTNG